MTQIPPENSHYNQKIKRDADFITPPNILKAKVGSGGLSEEILRKAQLLLENNAEDFLPLGNIYLDDLVKSLKCAEENDNSTDNETIIAQVLYPSMKLKANAGMFHYPLITVIADKLVQYLEVINDIDANALEIINAFHTTIKIVLTGKIQDDGGEYGEELVQALHDACVRYFERHPENK